MDVTVITGSGGGQTGVGDYTDDLVSHMNRVDIEVKRLPKRETAIFTYLSIAIQSTFGDTDLVHIQHEYGLFGPYSLMTFLFFPVLYLCSMITRTPVVVTIHESLNPELVTQPLRWLKGVYIQLLNRCISTRADHIIFLSQNSMEKFIKSTNITNYSVFSLGVNLDQPLEVTPTEAKRQFGFDTTDIVITEPGYISHRKGSHFVAELAQRLPKYEFMLAGGPEDEFQEQYLKKIERMSLPNLRLTGRLNEWEFQLAFLASDIVVLPYADVEQRGLINTVNQSAIFSKCATYQIPTVGADSQYFNRLQQEWGCIETVDVTDIPSFRQTISDLVENDEKREQLRQAMSTYAHENSLEHIARQHETLYQRQCGIHPS